MALSTRYSSRPTLGATRARQGRFGRHVVWVLLFSTLLAALGLFAAWTWKAVDFAQPRADRGQETVGGAAFSAPEPAPVIPQPAQKNTTPANPGPAAAPAG